MSASPSSRPDPRPVLAGLRDFQLRTVEYAFGRLYGEEDPTRRFLVADEVGLGKTMVARGVIARAVEELWDRLGELGRIDVVYICSNLDIARQNVNRLRLDRNTEFAKPTRMTLLPRTLRNLRGQSLNFVSLTPGTSFDPRSSMGTREERALLYLLLEDEWELRGAAPLNVLSGAASRESFDAHLRWLREEDDIDPQLAEEFRRRLRRSSSGDDSGLRARWERLLPHFQRAGKRSNRPEEAKAEQRELIGALRRLLAETCVRALEPDLIVLDEFQRFRDLLQVDPETGERTEAGELADVFFRYKDARVLLLSATPYKPYTQIGEEDGDHYRDFVETARFLLDDADRTAELEELLAAMRHELLTWSGCSAERLRTTKERVEEILRGVMCRTERLAATPERDGMLLEAQACDLAPAQPDVESFVATANVADALDEPDQLEFWKSSPYLLNLMDSYKLKRRLAEALSEEASPGERRDVEAALRAARPSLLPFDELRDYRGIEPQNARLRALAADTVDRGAWRLLWLPPSLPGYELGGPFADPALREMTKRLVFSSWTVVPKAIATLLSYEAERLTMLCGDPRATNTGEERARRGNLLEFKRSDGRLASLPVLALLYPSFALARLVSPSELAAGAAGGQSRLTRAGAVRAAATALRPAIDRMTERAPAKGRADERWYWAAPLLLDVDADREAALSWLQDDRLPLRWPGGDGERMRSDALWREHVAAAAAMASDPSDLGRVPGDLAEVLAQLALAGPGVAVLRALVGAAGDRSLARDAEVRIAAASVAWSLRSLFSTPEATELIRGLAKREGVYWRQVLGYCADGALQAVLDEYAHVLRDAQGLVGNPSPDRVARDLAEAMSGAIGVRASNAVVDEIAFSNGRPGVRKENLRMRFAMRFGHQSGGEDEEHRQRAEHVRQAFNSPFWPFVLASTSVGQEGLDFHPYCHAVVHWNLPSNPVDLEQREGRVHRYKGHAVRRNLAAAHGDAVLASAEEDVWPALFDAGVQARPPESNDLRPFWIAPGKAKIERHVLAAPLSRDARRREALKRSLALYRMVFGQARQGDLVDYLATRVPPEQLGELIDVLRIDLSPR